jgi:hypothetical protein
MRCTLLAEVSNLCTPDSLSHFNPMTYSATSPLGTGYRQAYGAQLSGGVSSLSYFTSGEYENEQGFLTMPAPDRQIYQARLGGGKIPDENLNPNRVLKVSLRGNVTGQLGTRGDLGISVGYVNNDTRVADFSLPRSAEFGPGYRDAYDGWLTNGEQLWELSCNVVAFFPRERRSRLHRIIFRLSRSSERRRHRCFHPRAPRQRKNRNIALLR